jgi:PAS domain S-box-containing protein
MLPDGHLLGVARDITERKRAEQLLSHSHDLMRHVIEHSRSAIAVHDRDLKYIYVSQRYLDEYKVKEQDVIGKHHYDVFPDLPQKWRDVHQRALAGEVSSAEDDPYVRDDGTVDWTRWECRPWYEADGAIGGIIVYTEVITERKRAEEAARAAEMLLRATMEAVADGILAVDARGAVVFTNARFADLWRIPHEIADSRDDAQLLGFVLDQLEDPAAFLAKVQALYHSAEGSVDTLCFKDGRVFERWSRPLLMNDGAIAGRVWCFRDVTERKRAEESRLEMERRMLHAQRLESLGVLAGGIAHDFNNLLMAILGNLELAQRDLSPVSPIRPRLDAASNAARRAADLTRQMLAYSGRGKFMVGRVDLNELVEENVHLLRTSIPRTTTLNLHLDRALPAVEADAGQIQQVVMNLITNASEAIGEVPGVITLSTGVRDCDGSYLGRSRFEEVPPAGRYAYFEVTDTGCGMDEETQKRMFEPFFTTKFTGRGLGLPAVFGIVRGHGGAILLDSAAGKGTAIRVLFPAAEVAPGAAGPAEAAPAGEAEVAPGRGRGTILIVDDEEMVLQPCAAMVESMGFAVLTAVDGEQAVEIVRRHGASIRAIILDLTMPKLDGAAAFEQILRIEPGAKVILSSGYDEAEATGRLAKEQLAGFIRKPYYLEQLRATLERVLGTAL